MSAAMANKYEWARRLLPLDLSGERWRVLYSVKEIHRDGVADVSVTAVAKMTGLNRRTVARHLKASETEGLLSVEWSKGGRAPHRIRLLEPTATPALLRQPDCRSTETLAGAVYCDSQGVAATATLYACAREEPYTLGGGPRADPPSGVESKSSVVEVFSPSSPAPDAPWKGAGADVIASPSEAVPVAKLQADAGRESATRVEALASSLAERIDAFEDELVEYRDHDTGELDVGLPRMVRSFFVREVDPGEAEFREIVHAFRQWQAGDFAEPLTDDELLAEYARRAAMPCRDDREHDDFPDFDDDFSLPAPTRRTA